MVVVFKKLINLGGKRKKKTCRKQLEQNTSSIDYRYSRYL